MLDRLRSLWSRLTLLQICLGISVAVHVALLGFRFVDPEGFNRTFKDTPLEVILVNAASEEAPEKAQALAQQNLLTQVRQELAALPPPQPRDQADTAQSRAEEERRRQLTKLLAEIEKRIHDENARPKKRYLSPATLRSVDALYYSAFRTQVERAGTTYFPMEKGQKLYGELVMEVWLNRQGKVVDAIVLQSSGNALLDKRARAIVMQAGPFGAVPAEVSAGNDLLLISSRFRFTRDAGMEATTTKAAPNTAP